MGDSVGWYGEFLQPQLDLLARMLRQGATVLEIGAGVGHHALPLSVTIGPTGHLILDEPRRVQHQILQQNLAANRVGNATLLKHAPDGSAIESVDDLQLGELDCLKLNDGMQAQAILEGAAATLWRLRPMLFVAAPDEPTLAVIARSAQTFGYRVWRMSTPLFNPGNFNRRDADIFAGATALAILALPEEIEFDLAIDGCVELS